MIAIPEVPVEQTALLARIQSEYSEMPGLILTIRQARRLWSLDEPVCEHLLGTLVESGFLRRTSTNAFLRASR